MINKYNALSEENKKKINIFLEIATLELNKDKKEILYSNKNIKENPLIKETSEYKLKKRVYNYRFYKPSSERSKTENTPYIGTVAAGTPNLSYYEGAYEYIHSPVKCDFAMRANGDSMYPVIKDNDYIFVKSTPFIDIGDIGIISIDGETTCKKFYIDDNKIILKSFNPDFKPLEYEINEFLNIKILGKVILTPDQEKNL